MATVLFVGAVGAGLIAAAGAAFILLNPPTDLIREQAVAAVRAYTGRDLTITGPAKLTFYPSIGVTLHDVSLSAPPAMPGPPTVSMESLDVSVKLLPLLTRNVEVNRLVLTRPRFDLRVDKAGQKSWDLALAPEPSAPVRYAEAKSGTLLDALPGTARALAQRGEPRDNADATSPHPKPDKRVATLDNLVLDDVRIVDGALSYVDEQNGTSQAVNSIDLTVKARTLSKPLFAKGDLDWRGQTVRFDGTLTTLAEILTDKPAKLAVKIDASALQADYDGTIDFARGANLAGDVTATSPSLRALALWVGKNLPPNDGFRALSLKGRLKSQPGAFRLDNADISLDETQAKGWIAGLTRAERPQIKAELNITELNLNTYLDGASHGGAASPAALPSAAPAPAPATPSAAHKSGSPPPQSIDDLLDRNQGPRVKGYTARAGWSDEPIDTALLGLADVDAKLSLGKLLYREVKIGASDLVLALKNQVAKATFERVALYDGSGRGIITIDASAAQPAISSSIVVDGVSGAPLLKDAAGVDWLSGKGKLTLATTSQGSTQRQLVSALNGKATFAFTDGAVRGFNVGKALRGLQQGNFTGMSATPAEQTDFSKLSASFEIVDGIATNQDLTLMSPLLRVTGNGRVMLPERQVDYTLHPKLVAELSGQGGATGLSGLEVPIRLTGPWSKPQIEPDLSKVDAKQAVEAVQEFGKRLKGKNADEVVDELFGKDTKESKKAKKFLDKLFR